MPSKVLQECMPVLRLVASIKNPTLRKQVLLDATRNPETLKCLYMALHELALNTVKGHIPLSPKLKERLRRAKQGIHIKALATPSNRQNKRRLVVQSGGWIPIVAPIAAAVITKIIDKLT